MKLSVVVTTRNEEANIANCIASFDGRRDDVEVIVVDNSSTDRTKEIAASLGAKVLDKGPERCAQRNLGWRTASADWVIILDADMILPSEALDEILSIADSPDAAGRPLAYWIPEVRTGSGIRTRARNFERSFYDGTAIDALRLFHKSVLEKTGGYDESLIAGGEDWELDIRILATGVQAAVLRNHLVHNEKSLSFSRLMAKKAYYAKGVADYQAKWAGHPALKKQFGLYYRYLGVFVENGKWRRLLRHPILTAVMYLERIAVGFVYLASLLRVAVCTCALMAYVSADAGEVVRGETFARWDARTLSVGNGLFEARLRMGGGLLRTVSLASGGFERLCIGEAKGGDEFSVSEVESAWSVAGDRELALAVSSEGRTATIRVWPHASGFVVEESAASPLPSPPGDKDWGSSVFSFGWNRFKSLDACGDAFCFSAPHLTARAFTPIDKTDLRAELLDEREFAMPTCEAMKYLRCSALDVREALTGRGVVFLKLAPMPESRSDPDAVDFAVNPSTRAVRTIPTGCPLAVLAYSGGEVGRLRAMRDFHRSLWPRLPGRDGVLLSNTWGDGNRDSRINEEFLLKEIAAATDIGVEVVQIDDGWQKGRSANSSQSRGKGVWNGYWAADPEFWVPDPVRFPRGLKPLTETAERKGVSIGLWFGPDSSDDAANWERDADCLLSFYRQFGIRHFKIDSLKLHTPTAFSRNRDFFAKMLRESGSRMCFDLDCTAEVRPGFLGGMPVGQLFAENRYAFRKGDKRIYYPHQTLRSLWTLSWILDPVRLRMEFLNPAKKDNVYGDDPLRPAAWPADALFAVTMLSSPLAWMELSDVPESIRAKWRPLIAKWKGERDALHDCVAVPVGGKPDGEAWTGFVSVGDGGGYALVFREGNARGDWTLDLRDYFPSANLSATVLSGDGSVSVDKGFLKVEIPKRLGYLWLAITSFSVP